MPSPLNIHNLRTLGATLTRPSQLIHRLIGSNVPTRLLVRTMASAAGKRLEGKTVLITGASSGIGKATAFEFARTAPNAGLKLILTARRIDTLQQIAADIAKETSDGVKVLPVQLDVSDPAAVRGFVPGLPAEFRDIHVLVNNAGLVRGVAKAPEIAEEDINVMFQTNVTGLINMTQAILPIFKARGADGGAGDIINIGSIAGELEVLCQAAEWPGRVCLMMRLTCWQDASPTPAAPSTVPPRPPSAASRTA